MCIRDSTLTYGQTEILLLFGKVIGEADVRDVQEMTASNVGLRMMTEEAAVKGVPLTQNFIRTLHKTILREDYTVYRNLPGGMQTSYAVSYTHLFAMVAPATSGEREMVGSRKVFPQTPGQDMGFCRTSRQGGQNGTVPDQVADGY